MIENAKSVRNPAGGIIVDGQQVADTARCCHCGAHWVMVRDDESTLPHYCRNCDDTVCDKPSCRNCVPAEKRLDLIERMARF